MNKFSRATSWAGLIWTLLVCLPSTQAQGQTDTTHPAPAPRRPNILLILADNIGYGDLGCYGQTKIKTPRLDQLAGEGIRFTSYYVGSPNDEPSRASLLTGLEPRHVGASFGHPLPSGAFTVATMLQLERYHTALVGEWNLGDTPPVEPNSEGFDEFVGFLSAGHARDYFTDTIDQQDSTRSTRLIPLQPNWNDARGRYVPDFLGTVAGNILRVNQPSALNHFRSFFLCLSYPVPHNGNPPADSIYSDESWPQAAKDRASMITHMDQSIGTVLDSLAQFKLDTNTVVIFTSIGGPKDEGASGSNFFNSAGPLRGKAGSVYEGGIRVPMIVRWPARIKPGQVSDFAWAAWDFLPTAAEIAFLTPPKKTDGISILPVLTGKGQVAEHESFRWESAESVSQEAVRLGDWKLVQIETNAPELYDLKTDIGERKDLAAKEPNVVKQLQSFLGGR